jgi:hypothetical protein
MVLGFFIQSLRTAPIPLMIIRSQVTVAAMSPAGDFGGVDGGLDINP